MVNHLIKVSDYILPLILQRLFWPNPLINLRCTPQTRNS